MALMIDDLNFSTEKLAKEGSSQDFDLDRERGCVGLLAKRYRKCKELFEGFISLLGKSHFFSRRKTTLYTVLASLYIKELEKGLSSREPRLVRIDARVLNLDRGILILLKSLADLLRQMDMHRSRGH
ncbi:unnamed protein product [Amoebophrya sp. A25]|nr:unnamed protein product [Amoebophrya sp. A25]|eukprot:GSA25T00001288001.1